MSNPGPDMLTTEAIKYIMNRMNSKITAIISASVGVVRSLLIFFLLSAAVMLTPGPAGAQDTSEAAAAGSLRKVSVALQWLPQAQFAGFFAARDTGIYRKYGLDVTIINGGPTEPSSKALEEKKADFCTMFLSTALTKAQGGLALVNLAQLSKKSSIMFVAKKKSGISKLADLNGRKVGLWISDSRTIPQAFLRLNKIEPTVVDIASSIDIFLYDGIDAINAMRYHEYYEMYAAGIDPDELSVFALSDNGFDLPEDGIYCLSETFARDRKLCEDFTRASIEGWKYAFDNRENAAQIVLNYSRAVHQRSNVASQRYMLDAIGENFCPQGGREKLGSFSEEEYRKAADLLVASGLITSAPAFGNFIRNCVDSDVKKQ